MKSTLLPSTGCGNGLAMPSDCVFISACFLGRSTRGGAAGLARGTGLCVSGRSVGTRRPPRPCPPPTPSPHCLHRHTTNKCTHSFVQTKNLMQPIRYNIRCIHAFTHHRSPKGLKMPHLLKSHMVRPFVLLIEIYNDGAKKRLSNQFNNFTSNRGKTDRFS